jgi:hypothetical protein
MNQRTIKLFTVVALAGASTAEAGPRVAKHEAAPPAKQERVAREVTPRTEAQPARVDWSSYFDIKAMAAIKPRTLANGRPACGNTGGKAPPKCDQDDAELAKL